MINVHQIVSVDGNTTMEAYDVPSVVLAIYCVICIF